MEFFQNFVRRSFTSLRPPKGRDSAVPNVDAVSKQTHIETEFVSWLAISDREYPCNFIIAVFVCRTDSYIGPLTGRTYSVS